LKVLENNQSVSFTFETTERMFIKRELLKEYILKRRSSPCGRFIESKSLERQIRQK